MAPRHDATNESAARTTNDAPSITDTNVLGGALMVIVGTLSLGLVTLWIVNRGVQLRPRPLYLAFLAFGIAVVLSPIGYGTRAICRRECAGGALLAGAIPLVVEWYFFAFAWYGQSFVGPEPLAELANALRAVLFFGVPATVLVTTLLTGVLGLRRLTADTRPGIDGRRDSRDGPTVESSHREDRWIAGNDE